MPSNEQDLSGMRIGRWMVLSPAHKKGSRTAWHCVCDCGKRGTPTDNNLLRGKSRSCGCAQREAAHRNRFLHGLVGSKEHTAWANAKARCFDPKNPRYACYGGRGIYMCAEWAQSFAAFLTHIGPAPGGTTLDRIDVNRGYEPGNVRWATKAVQARNKRTTRLDLMDASAIKTLYRDGVKQTHIAALFDITQGMVGRIVRGDAWVDAEFIW